MWFRTKVKYKVQNARGKWKARSEEYLINAVSYGDVEASLVSVTENRINDYTHIIREANFRDVYEPHLTGAFYSVTIEEEVYSKSGEPKKRSFKQLVVAESVSDAQNRAAEYMKRWVVDTKIIGADITPIVGVWHPHAQPWKDDFNSRAVDGFARDKKNTNTDPNQTSAFNADGTVKEPTTVPTTAPATRRRKSTSSTTIQE